MKAAVKTRQPCECGVCGGCRRRAESHQRYLAGVAAYNATPAWQLARYGSTFGTPLRPLAVRSTPTGQNFEGNGEVAGRY
jgi:hypothetical protein